MDYSVKDTYDEKEMRAYRAARYYIQNAFLDAGAKDGGVEVMKFVLKVIKEHGDVNVEVN